MEMADTAGIELPAQLCGDRRCNQLARGRQVVETFEKVIEP